MFKLFAKKFIGLAFFAWCFYGLCVLWLEVAPIVGSHVQLGQSLIVSVSLIYLFLIALSLNWIRP